MWLPGRVPGVQKWRLALENVQRRPDVQDSERPAWSRASLIYENVLRGWLDGTIDRKAVCPASRDALGPKLLCLQLDLHEVHESPRGMNI